MRIIAVSPHFDDVPLSLGAALRHGALARHEVAVPVVFEQTNWTIWVHPTAGRARMVSRWRRLEESVAARWFGYRRLPGAGMSECILRLGDLDPAAFLDPGFEPESDPSLAAVVGLLEQWRARSDALLVPLGAGDHIDHRLVTAAATVLLDRGVDGGVGGVAFYEDRPYAASLSPSELEAVARRTGRDLEPLDVSAAAGPAKRRILRLVYPSQIDAAFRTALRLDEQQRRPERLWVPTGEVDEWRHRLGLVTGR